MITNYCSSPSLAHNLILKTKQRDNFSAFVVQICVRLPIHTPTQLSLWLSQYLFSFGLNGSIYMRDKMMLTLLPEKCLNATGAHFGLSFAPTQRRDAKKEGAPRFHARQPRAQTDQQN